MGDEAALADLSSEVLDYIDELEDARDVAVAKSVELQTVIDESSDGEPTETDPIAKALGDAPEELVQLFKSQAERLTAAEADLASQKEATQNGEWVAKARSFDGLVDPEAFGPKLRAIAATDSELADDIAKTMEAAGKEVAKSKMFDEIGHTSITSAEGEAVDQAEAIAKAASAGKASEADRAKVWEEGDAEPSEWQIDCYDSSSTRRTLGTVG